VITLIGGNTGIPNGYIRFQLNTDARVIAAPYGQVPASLIVTFQLDAAGNLIPTAQLYSNAELNPQLSSTLLATYYLVTFYDQNGAIINAVPMRWQFPEASGATVSISQMIAVSTVGGNVIYYPTPILTIASGAVNLNTALIASGAKSTIITIAAPGVLATDKLLWNFSIDPTSTTGYAPAAGGVLEIDVFCTAGNVNFYVLNNTSGSITPGAVTLNWQVVR
jgi:hypothetical protein